MVTLVFLPVDRKLAFAETRKVISVVCRVNRLSYDYLIIEYFEGTWDKLEITRERLVLTG